jgi:type II secretory pathway component GspD/PulD (secretin)
MSRSLQRLALVLCVLITGAARPAARSSAETTDGEPPAASAAPETERNPFAALLAQPPQGNQAPALPPEPPARPELRLETIVLKFLDAHSVQGALERMVSPHGTVAINEKNNSVVICDTADSVQRVVAEIKKVDQTPLQVLVEVVVLDVQLQNDTEVGVNWDLLSHDTYDVVYRQNLTSSRLQSTPETEETIGMATVFNTVGLGGDFSLVSGTIRHVLHLIQQKRDVEILASPKALVVSGETATIKAVEEIPYQEVSDTAAGGVGALTSTRFKEVGVNLQVSATVTDGDSIFVSVDTQQSVRTGESDSGIPVVDTRQANTSLLLEDGQIVVIGGLRREEKTVQTNQVPVLGDLPLVGWLFKGTITVNTHSELVVVLSPRIHRGEPIPDEIAARLEALAEESPLRSAPADPSTSESVQQQPPQDGRR